MEGSPRAVNRTVSASAEDLVGFNVFPRYRDSVSELSQRLHEERVRRQIPVPAECREFL